ncbi:MAG TPA: FlgD immunoglobulin-like domain containing protein, partial [Candidatus Krumholzibacteria bacterium]|nr:FlgD immunoglobulin-like domain containing protein [Candidatus Krumholzibacteria bacterium]
NLVPHWMASGWYVALRPRDAAGAPVRDPRRGARFAVWSALVFSLVAAPVTTPAVVRHLWSAGFGDSLDQYMGSVALHPAGGIAAVGSFTGTIDLGGGPFTATGFEDKIFVARFDTNGAHLWSRSFAQVPLVFSPWVHAVATDPDGNVIVAGEFGGTLNLGGATLSASGTRSMFLAKFDANGAHVWSRRYGTSAVARSLATDAVGNIALGGDATGIVDFGGGALVAQGASDACIAVLNPDGSHRWSKRMGPLNNQSIGEVAMDRSGRVAVSGLFTSSIVTDGGTLISAGESDVFVAVHDAAGGHLWSRRIGGTFADTGTDVAIDSLAGVVVTGVFRGTIDTGSETLTAPAAVGDGFVAAYDLTGIPLWSIQLGATESATVEAIAAGEAGNLIIAGRFRPAMTLGTTTFPGPDGFIGVLNANADEPEVLLLRSGGASLAVDADAQGRVAFGATSSVAMNLGGDAVVIAGLQDVILAELSTRAVLLPIVSFGAVAEVSAVVVVRWVILDDLVAEFALERWTTDPAQRTLMASGPVVSHNGRFEDRRVQPRGTYTYELTVRASGGAEFQSSPATVTVPPVATSLLQNAPNPFASSTDIEYRLDWPADVVIGIYDVTGARVRLLDEGPCGGGIHSAAWDGRDQAGRPVGSGVYFYRIENLTNAEPRKMMLVR